MRKLLLAPAICLCTILWGQSIDFTTASSIGGPDEDRLGDIANDTHGNTYVCGTFKGSITLGTIVLTSQSPNHTDAFVGKRSVGGDWIWAKGLGGTSSDRGVGIALDGAGHLYVAAQLAASNTITYGSTPVAVTAPAVVIAKLDTAGQWIHHSSVEGPGPTFTFELTMTAQGDVIVAFDHNPWNLTLSFDGLLVNCGGSMDVVVAKLAASGIWQWAKTYFVPLPQFPEVVLRDVVVDDAGNVYIGGWFQGYTMQFDQVTLNAEPYAFWDQIVTFYIVQLDANGIVQWGRTVDPDLAGNSGVSSFVWDPAGSLIALINYTDEFGINGSTWNGYSAVLARLNANGAYLSTDSMTNWTGVVGIREMVLADDGSLYGVGDYGDPFTVGGDQLTNQGARDQFIAHFSGTGVGLGAFGVGGSGDDWGTSLALSDGHLTWAGNYHLHAVFPGTSLPSIGDEDVFITHVDAGSVGGQEEGLAEGIFIHPNPTNGAITINADPSILGAPLSIHDGLGHLVHQEQVGKTTFMLDLAPYGHGLYTVRSGTFSARIAVE